jgi:sugar phosphate isomerase/epimerase
MNQFSRREWSKMMLSGMAAAALPLNVLGKSSKPNSKINGVQIGVQTYSFRTLTLDQAIAGMVDIGLDSVELWQGHVEPKGLSREEMRKWRLSVPLAEFQKVRQKFDKAGISLYAYNLSVKEDYTDEEIDRGFQMAKALGVNNMTASAHVSVSKRVDKYAKKYKITMGMHNHSKKIPNEFATPENFFEAMNGNSKYIKINLDIGHFTAANYDAVDFLKKHHDKIVCLHIKDRKKDEGDNVPFGQGDTPIKEVLTLMKKQGWTFPANLEYEYKGEDTLTEVKRCLEYCRSVLTA